MGGTARSCPIELPEPPNAQLSPKCSHSHTDRVSEAKDSSKRATNLAAMQRLLEQSGAVAEASTVQRLLQSRPGKHNRISLEQADLASHRLRRSMTPHNYDANKVDSIAYELALTDEIGSPPRSKPLQQMLATTIIEKSRLKLH